MKQSIQTMTIDADTVIIPPARIRPIVRHALTFLQRDMEKVFGRMPFLASSSQSPAIVLQYADPHDEIAGRPEAFRILCAQNEPTHLYIIGSDDLGLMYGVLYVSRTFLGVDPFWFWADLEPETQSEVSVPAMKYCSPVPRVRYRGWFVNDETCFFNWKGYPPSEELWYPVFETLLRLGGNMVIPGTDLPRNGSYWTLAAEMGLWFAHHHIEYLGADMFSRRFPETLPNYEQYPEQFELLWREGIIRQKANKVVWTLGFRGQGDHPFWDDDPTYDTPEKRGKIITKIIQRQYEILCEYIDDPVCCSYIYGELTELYRKGYLKFPKGTIKIWSDNGYGKMLSRRQWLDNPRLPSLPHADDVGPHGLYFHVAFHDLQASNHLTMTPSPELIRQELHGAFEAGADTYLLLNTGIIRPHLYMLDLVSKLWLDGDADVNAHCRDFAARMFPSAGDDSASWYQRYFETPFLTGPNDDEKAGDEFYHHSLRPLIATWIRGKDSSTCPDLTWATGNIPFIEQIQWCQNVCQKGKQQWQNLHEEYLTVLPTLLGRERRFFQDNLLLGVLLHETGCQGFATFCEAYFAYRENNLPLAFLRASQALWAYQESVNAMLQAEHGKWENFYSSDWTNNVRMTVYSLETLRRYLRAIGDNDRFTGWSNKFVWHIKGDQKVQYKPMSDDELAKALERIL